MSHLDLDRLADLEEDLLTPEEAGEAEAHLRACADCRGLQAQLRGTRSLLTALPPEQMPAAVSARIDAALSALPATTIVPLSSKRRGWRAHPTAAGLGAAAAVAALVAALVVGKTSSHSPSTEAGGSADSLGTGAARASVPLPTTSVSGNHYTAHNLDRTVSALLTPVTAMAATPQGGAGATPQPSTAKAAASPEPALNRLFTSPAALEACVRGIEGGPAVQPLAIDFATYQGAPAVLVVLPGLEQGKVDAWFVGANCTASDPNLLRYRSLPDPNAATSSPGG